MPIVDIVKLLVEQGGANVTALAFDADTNRHRALNGYQDSVRGIYDDPDGKIVGDSSLDALFFDSFGTRDGYEYSIDAIDLADIVIRISSGFGSRYGDERSREHEKVIENLRLESVHYNWEQYEQSEEPESQAREDSSTSGDDA